VAPPPSEKESQEVARVVAFTAAARLARDARRAMLPSVTRKQAARLSYRRGRVVVSRHMLERRCKRPARAKCPASAVARAVIAVRL